MRSLIYLLPIWLRPKAYRPPPQRPLSEADLEALRYGLHILEDLKSLNLPDAEVKWNETKFKSDTIRIRMPK